MADWDMAGMARGNDYRMRRAGALASHHSAALRALAQPLRPLVIRYPTYRFSAHPKRVVTCHKVVTWHLNHT